MGSRESSRDARRVGIDDEARQGPRRLAFGVGLGEDKVPLRGERVSVSGQWFGTRRGSKRSEKLTLATL